MFWMPLWTTWNRFYWFLDRKVIWTGNKRWRRTHRRGREGKFHLSNESWDDVFTEDNADMIFNKFLNTYLRIFYQSFPYKKGYHKHINKPWISIGIKKSCQHKRDLYLLCRKFNNPTLKNHYKIYCKVLTNVIKTAKKLYYDKRILSSNNSAKTWVEYS